MRISFLVTLLFLISFLNLVNGQNIILTQSNENGIYARGQKIRVKLFVRGNTSDSVTVKIRKNYSDNVIPQKIYFKGDTLTIFNQSFSESTSLIVEAATKTETASIGSVVEPKELKPGTPRPRDMNSFWKSEKKTLRALPMEIKMNPVKKTDNGFICYNVEINCTGPKPARGYFAKPLTAKPGTLPIVLFVHSAGVKGFWCRSQPGNAMAYAEMGNGALGFDLNAHGMLNGQSDQYYEDLENNELKNYTFQGIESKELFYFRGMYLRLIRTLDFLTQQPEWDGKHILVIGQSQGGGQALVAAGLDHRVSAVVASLPAMCDWGGKLAGRKGGWPQPLETKNDLNKMLASVPYFDAAHLLKGTNAKIFAEIGLIDNTCPATSVYAAINQARGEKIMIPIPYLGHTDVPVQYKKIWEESVDKLKKEFIANSLK